MPGQAFHDHDPGSTLVTQRRNVHAVHVDRAHASRSLQRADRVDVINTDDSLRHRQHPFVEVDVRPTEAEPFAAP